MSSIPTPYLDPLRSVAEAVQITYPITFSWLGEPAGRLSPAMRRALGEDKLPGRLHQLLTQRLYESFYAKGRPCPAGWDRIGLRSPAHNVFLNQSLSGANQGQGYFQDGWRAVEAQTAQGLHVVERQGLRVRVPESALRRSPEPGGGVEVHFGKELVNGLPSFYLAMGDVELPDEAIPTCVRLYWNTDPATAIDLTRAITTHLNRERIPFRFKVVNDPTLFNRHDAAVLYLDPADYVRAFEALWEDLPSLLGDLRPGVPALTRPLAPGLSVAEDPGEAGDSFGLHRCRCLARGLVTAAENHVQDLDRRVEYLVESLEAVGIDPSKPYLRPGSADIYDLELPTPQRTKSPQGFSSTGTTTRTRTPGDVAELLGSRLVRSALWHGERCTWLGSEDHLNWVGTAPVYQAASLAPNLYTGTGGVALFLAELFHHTGEPSFQRTALGALRQTVRGLEHAASKTTSGGDPLFPGYFGGAAGLAVASRRIAALCPADDLAERTQALFLSSLEGSLERWENDLVTGVAGALLGLATLGKTHDPAPLLPHIDRCVRALATTARRQGPVASWASPAFPRTHHLTGYLHGTAGIAHAFLEAFTLNSDPRVLELAEAAFAYEDGWFDADQGTWPDLRNLQRGEAPRTWPTSWCHGAAGIALARARAFEITGRDPHRHMARVAIESVMRDVRSTLEDGGGNFSLAEGLPGSLDAAFLAAQRIEEGLESPLEDLAQAVADEGIHRHLEREIPWAGGVASGESPGLFVGLAGIGHSYLRRAAPATPSPLFCEPPNVESSSKPGPIPDHKPGAAFAPELPRVETSA